MMLSFLLVDAWLKQNSFQGPHFPLLAFAISIAIFNNDSSLPTFISTVPTRTGHCRIVPVPVFREETTNTVFMTYPMHIGRNDGYL